VSGADVITVALTESQWQRQVLDLARLYGWRAAHFRPARTAHGWRTPVQADGAGFPDLALVRGRELVFAELKAASGRPTPAQREWLDALGAVPGVRAECWRPGDFDHVHDVLRRREGALGDE
jgi:hypothetical protein